MDISEQAVSAATEQSGLTGQDLPRVSVVVPVLNAAADVGRLLESLMALDYPRERLELIVVDNGSEDGSDRVISGFPVTLLRESQVQSSYAARNKGVEAATGEWIAFTDADCVVSRDWLKELLAPPRPADVGAVAGEVLALETKTVVQRLTERYGLMKHAVTLPHKALPCFSTANVAVRREVLTALHGFRGDVRFFGDMELSWRMQLELDRRLLFRPQAVVLHRHRRTVRGLWWHGCQHGRGVAFMKQTYPHLYRIGLREQMVRIAGIFGAVVSWFRRSGSLDHQADRWFAPVFLSVWYLGMSIGYLSGPARAYTQSNGVSTSESS